MSEEDPRRPGMCACGQRLNMHDQFYCVPVMDDEDTSGDGTDRTT